MSRDSRNPMTSMPFKSLFALLGAALLAAAPAQARRPVEDKIFMAPMPHEQAGGPKVKAHYVSRHARDPQGPGASLQALRQTVQECVPKVIRSKRKPNPPTAWPDEAQAEARFDTYYAANRTITYEHSVHFAVNHADCSLVEAEIWSATLQSSRGICQINLLNKTYQGQCDAKAHEQAAVLPLPPTPSLDQQQKDLARMRENPQTAAMAAAMQAVLPMASRPTGAVKTIAGVKCDVMTAGGPTPGTKCVVRGGSFVPATQASETGAREILLEVDIPKAVSSVADRVKLDGEVGAAVFAPHLNGFTRADEGDAQ